jgi:hypothetical protein
MPSTFAIFLLASQAVVYDPLFHGGFDPPDVCPAGRQTVADIGYTGDGSGTVRHNVDVTEWENIWGDSTPYDTPVPWPGRMDSAPVIRNFGKSTYVAAHFRVPAGTPTNWFGWIARTEYSYGTDLTGAISVECGDFRPSAQVCFTAGVSGQNVVPWRTNAGNFCPLKADADYYLNLRVRDPDQTDVPCPPAAGSCAVGTANSASAP